MSSIRFRRAALFGRVYYSYDTADSRCGRGPRGFPRLSRYESPLVSLVSSDLVARRRSSILRPNAAKAATRQENEAGLTPVDPAVAANESSGKYIGNPDYAVGGM